MKKLLYISLFLSVFYTVNAQNDSQITVPELKSHLQFLAGDELKGRLPGAPGDPELFGFISSEFKSYGLQFFSGNGIQEFDFISTIKQGPSNTLSLNGQAAVAKDFMPFSFSSSKVVEAKVVFAGYGYEFKNDTLNRNDYANLNVKDKWVLIFRGNPQSQDQKNAYSAGEKDRDKVLLAKDKGAAGVLLVSGAKFDNSDELNAMSVNLAEVGIPCFQVSRLLADNILAKDKTTIDQLENLMYQKSVIKSFETKAKINAQADVIQQKTKTANVIAYIKGSDPALADQYIVIGAHHDHLGMGGPGSSSRQPDTIAIHYGADDNASGVTSVLEMAEKISSLKPGRSIIFATFGAEEKGLLGSAYFVAHPPVPLEKIVLMLNLDMVGRLRDSSLQIGGVGTSPDFRSILLKTEKNYPFILSLSDAGYGPSDHASFYTKDKPVLFFSTGAHAEYHTPYDRVDAINLEGLKDVTEYVADLAVQFSEMPERLAFREAGPKESTSGRYRGKITFGIMPDVSEEGTSGMKVLAVTEGKPASNAGMKKGDIIVSIDNKPVGNIQDYMFRLGQLKAGDRVPVGIMRNGNRLDLIVQL